MAKLSAAEVLERHTRHGLAVREFNHDLAMNRPDDRTMQKIRRATA